jgi:hypothetical protein
MIASENSIGSLFANIGKLIIKPAKMIIWIIVFVVAIVFVLYMSPVLLRLLKMCKKEKPIMDKIILA